MSESDPQDGRGTPSEKARKRSVLHHLDAARDRLHDADVQLRCLADETAILHTADEANKRLGDVRSFYLAWLVFIRQVAVSISESGKAAGRPKDFADWWEPLREDQRHAYFTASRNQGLKLGDEVIGSEPVVDFDLVDHGYFAFADGPFKGDPLVLRCQEYTEWVYRECLCNAQEKLFPHFKDDVANAAKSSTFFG